MVRRLRNRPGKVKLGCLFTLVIVSALAFYGVNIGEVVINFYEYQDAMAQEAKFAAHTADDAIIAHLRAKADSLGLPIEAQKITVRRRGGQIWIWAVYHETIELPFTMREYELMPHVEGDL
jgi:hypothetical protein